MYYIFKAPQRPASYSRDVGKNSEISLQVDHTARDALQEWACAGGEVHVEAGPLDRCQGN
jgi:hypothetical protein